MKRTFEECELPWRVRRPLTDQVYEPHVMSPPRNAQQRRLTLKPTTKSRLPDPLEALGVRASRTKEQIDALEKMLHSAMPPRVVLDNSFAGLRNAIADEIELGMESQWRKGVQHGEWLSASKILELEAEVNRLRGSYRDLQMDYTKVMSETQHD